MVRERAKEDHGKVKERKRDAEGNGETGGGGVKGRRKGKKKTVKK